MALKKDDDLTGLSVADLIVALRAAAGNDDETMERRARFEAEAHKRLAEPENKTHPGVSAYNPLGDIASPRPPLVCQMFWVGYDLQPDNLSADEIRLLNQATPGEFQFHRTDGSIETMTVTAARNADGSLHKMEFTFPCRGEYRANLPGMIAQLRECYGLQSAEQQALAAALIENAKLKTLLVELTGTAVG